jgi:hypothetical protein
MHFGKHSLKSLFGKLILSAVALSGFLVFLGAPAAEAQEWRGRAPVRYEHRGDYGWRANYWHHEVVRHGWRDRFGYWHP